MICSKAGKTFIAKKLLLVVAGLTILLLLLFIVTKFPHIIETWYSSGLYIFISNIWHWLLGWIPFSVGDLFYVVIILVIIRTLWKIIRTLFRKQYRQFGLLFLKFIIGIQLFIAAFYILWGLNYSRPPAAQLLSLPDSAYTFNQLQSVTKLLIDSTNACRSHLPASQQKESNKIIYQNSVAAIKQLGKQNIALRSFYPAVKPSLFTFLLNYMGTAGYFNPFSGEAQINYKMPIVNRPVTACHEMAHQMGFAREDEANFVGYLAGKESSNRLLKYSAYYMAMQEFMHQLYRRDTVVYHQYKNRLSPDVTNDIKADRAFWEQYENKLGYLSILFYDRFLKLNNQPEGMRTYNRMINLTMAYYQKKSLPNPPRNGGNQ